MSTSLVLTLVASASGYSSLAAPSLRPSLAPRSAAPPRPVVASLLPPAHDDDAHWPAVRKLLPLLGLGALALVPAAAHASSLATVGQVGDSAFVQATSLIFVSEIGDKTFFIATLLAARASRLLTFAGCAGALALMTVISVAIGQIFHAVPAELVGGLPLDDYVAIASFIFFGIKSITDALAIEEGGPSGIDEEREEAEKTLQETGADRKGGWPLVGEAFTLTVAAEIGDRSQIATIALAAAQNPFAVCGAPRSSAQFRCNSAQFFRRLFPSIPSQAARSSGTAWRREWRCSEAPSSPNTCRSASSASWAACSSSYSRSRRRSGCTRASSVTME